MFGLIIAADEILSGMFPEVSLSLPVVYFFKLKLNLRHLQKLCFLSLKVPK